MYKVYDKQLTKNKFLEAELRTEKDVHPEEWFNIHLQWTTEIDHAGLEFKFSFLKLIDISARIYDNRFWNERINDWHNDRSWQDYVSDHRFEDF
jgi:hypothetical protein